MMENLSMATNVYWGFINWRKSPDCVNAIINKFNLTKGDYSIDLPSHKTDNRGNSYNSLIEYAKISGRRYLVICHDDVIIDDDNVINEYIDFMQLFKQKIMTFGFGSNNRVMNGIIPNPLLEVNYCGTTFNVVRFPGNDLIVIDMEGGVLPFRTDINAMHVDIWLWENYKAGNLLKFGMFFDIKDSWKKISLNKTREHITKFAEADYNNAIKIASANFELCNNPIELKEALKELINE